MRTKLLILTVLFAGASATNAVAGSHAEAPTAARMIEEAQISAAIAAQDETADMLALEPGVLAGSAARASRKGRDLHLRLSRAPDRVLTNRDDCDSSPVSDERCVSFALLADLKTRHAYFVLSAYFEGVDYRLIDDRDGHATHIDAPPQFGPTTDRFITIDGDLAYGCDCVTIWRRVSETWVRSWSHPLDGADAHLVIWERPDSITIEFAPPASAPSKDNPHRTTITFSRGDWRAGEGWP